jgi:hypothetical protein
VVVSIVVVPLGESNDEEPLTEEDDPYASL